MSASVVQDTLKFTSSPAFSSGYEGPMQTCVASVLGTIQVMVGLFNIGLGPGRSIPQPRDVMDLGAPYWLGAVYIVSGVLSILSGKRRSPSLVGFAVFMNVVGATFAVTGIVLYAIDLAHSSVAWMCEGGFPEDSCQSVAFYAKRLLIGMDVTLIVMAVLQLCVNISFAVLGIKASVLTEKVCGDAEEDQSLMKDVLITSPGA